MKTLLLIFNPKAGKGAIRGHLSAVVEELTRGGYRVTAWPTQGAGDATRMAAAHGGEYDKVVCCGGDGTLNEVVSGLLRLEQPPTLGYIPTGTTNDFSRNLHLPRGYEKMAGVAARGEARPCDVGEMNGRVFIYVAAFGAFTNVSYDTPQAMKNAFGHLAYVLSTVSRLGDLGKGHALTVEHDGGRSEGEYIYGMVANTTSVGGIPIFPAKEVRLDDGKFELLLIRKPTKLAQLNELVRAVAHQKPTESALVEVHHTSRLTVTAKEALPWTLDGEYGGDPEVARIENKRQALRLTWGK